MMSENAIYSKNGKEKVLKGKFIPGTVFAWLALAFHAFVLFSLVVGLTTFYGKTVDVMASVNLCLGVLSMGKLVYRGLVGAAFGVLYIITLVVQIKNLVSTAHQIKRSGASDANTSRNALLGISSNLGSCIASVIVYVMLFCFVKNTSVKSSFLTIIILALVLMIAARVLNGILNSESLDRIIARGVVFAMFSLALAISLIHGATPVFEVALNSFSEFVVVDESNIVDLLVRIAQNIVNLILSISLLTLASDFVASNDLVESSYVKQKSRKALIVLIVYEACFIGRGFLGSSSSVTIEDVISIASPNLSVVFSVIALVVIAHLEYPEFKFFKKADAPCTEAEENIAEDSAPAADIAESETADADALAVSAEPESDEAQTPATATINDKLNSILFINYKTQIEERAYFGRDDLSIVVLPSSVTSVGKNAFEGCNNLKLIILEASDMPAEWDPDWFGGCNAKIYLDSSVEVINEMISVLKS